MQDTTAPTDLRRSAADLHVHSRFSDRPSEWILRRLGSPESFVEPLTLYQRAVAAGLDFVTITDHNTIAGALDLTAFPNTFVSSEITTYFPEDGCKVHLLAYGITEGEFQQIQDLRQSIYELRDYLLTEDIAHTVGHPLYAVNDTLTVAHFEKLLLLFNCFEVLNGSRNERSHRLVEALLGTLTPERLTALADRHGIAPAGPTPWVKRLTGGSDDHSGVYIGSAYTLTPPAANVTEFLAHLRLGRHAPAGAAANSVKLAHGFYHIAASYYRHRFLNRESGRSVLLHRLLERLIEDDQSRRLSGPRSGWYRVWDRLCQPLKRRRLSAADRQLVDEFTSIVDLSGPALEPQARGQRDEHTFDLACRISHQLSYHFLRRLLTHVNNVSLMEGLQAFASLGPVALGIAPYLAAFANLHKDELLHREARAAFGLTADRPERRAWLTDTFDDVNGVARTIRTLATLAQARGLNLQVITCLERAPAHPEFALHNFAPVGTFALPEYQGQTMVFPPFLNLLDHLERGEFSEVILSTPGPLGLTGLAAAHLFGLRTTGIYHTDFPRYVQILTDDETMGQIAWRYMCWFYGQLDMVLAPSEYYRQQLLQNGLEPDRVRVMLRGVDTRLFSPAKRDPAFWQRYGTNGGFKFLYVGRVSKEKSVDRLVSAFRAVRQRGHGANLIVVGDGPLLPELRRTCANDPDIVFTGFLLGEELARAYASADAFVFPSTTDTFGNVVLEAQASGLPTVVTSLGGPAEIVQRRRSGLVIDPDQEHALTEAMVTLCTDAALHAQLRDRALVNAQESSWSSILDVLWSASTAPAPTGTKPTLSRHPALEAA